jgi:carboxymethylenebutenolidase
MIEIDGVRHYLAQAEQAKAGLLLLPYFYGITPHMREFADMYAARGLTTLVWNPYPNLEWGAPFDLTTRPPRPTDRASIASQSACLDALAARFGLESFGTIGYCMGARSVLVLAAHERRLRAAVACYPSMRAQLQPGEEFDPVTIAAQITCPVMMLSAGKDLVTPLDIYEGVQRSLQSRTGRDDDTTVLYYPDAGHGFLHVPDEANDAAARSALPLVQSYLEVHLTGTLNGGPLPWAEDP